MDKPAILAIDDESNLLRFFEYNIRDLGFDAVTGETGEDLRRLLGEKQYATVLLDMMLPDANGLDLLSELHRTNPDLPVIMITAYGTIDKAVEAMKRGAFDFLTKPVDIDRFNNTLRNAVEQNQLRREVRSLRRKLEPPREFHGMAGNSPQMLEIYSMIESVAPTTATVMITGESGTGKELVARAIHELSGRSGKPFIAINCAAIPRDLLENELFGHEKGSFTGAVELYKGCFERAHEGTLFLDEIAEMDLGLQAKLLRLIQERVFYRIGATRPTKVDVRILSATNKDPSEAVQNGRFREDLFYRLNVLRLHLPALRERREDIGLIAAKFLLELAAANERRFHGFDLKALRAMERYTWPGNVRELRNVIEHIVILNDGDRVTVEMLPEFIRAARAATGNAESTNPPFATAVAGDMPASPESIQPFWQVERDRIQNALDLCAGNVQEVARRLEISPATLYRKIEKYGLVK
ncbi:sigma-54 dependent transcriptional regulator [bacterium]|nr:sigma-54 dependent transcriptional regulator [bacterium]